MSTRANIFIRDNYHDHDKEVLYHHCDGYPKGVGRDLENILKKFGKEYPDALLTKILVAEYICQSNSDFRITTPYMAGDAEYIYEIDLEKRRVEWIHLATRMEEFLCFF